MAIEDRECFPVLDENDTGGQPGGSPAGGGGGGSGGAGGQPAGDEINTDTGLNASSGDGRQRFRGIESSDNFMTLDKTVRQSTSAVSRKKTMILASHYLNYGSPTDSRLYNDSVRYPSDIYLFQDEMTNLYNLDYTPNIEFHNPKAGKTLGRSVRTTYPSFFHSADPLLYCLGGYWRDVTAPNTDPPIRAIASDVPRNSKNRLSSTTLKVCKRHNWDNIGAANSNDYFSSKYFPFEVSISPLQIDKEKVQSYITETNETIFGEPGFKEEISFRPADGEVFGNGFSRGFEYYGSRNYKLLDTAYRGVSQLANYLYGHSCNLIGHGGEPADFDGDGRYRIINYENLITKAHTAESKNSFYYYNFETDMPFFAREVEKIDNMKNLTVSIDLESNFITSEYRRYGDQSGEKETFLPSIYTLHTFDKADTLPEASKREYFNAVQPVATDDYMKKLLFTSDHAAEMQSVNDQYKSKVPMYVEFNIGTNQGSGVAEMLKQSGLDKLFLEFVSQQTLERNNQRATSFAEIISGAGPINSRGQRDLFITESNSGRHQIFDFSDWINLFLTEEQQTNTNSPEVDATLTSELVEAAVYLANFTSEDVTDTVPRSARISGHRASSRFVEYFFSELENPRFGRNASYIALEIDNMFPYSRDIVLGRNGMQSENEEIRLAQARLNNAYTAYQRVGANSNISNLQIAGPLQSANEDPEAKREMIQQLLSGIDIKNFPFEMNTTFSQFNQFKMLLQAIVMKGKITNNYGPLYQKYSEIIKNKDYSYSETILYRIDKHKADFDGNVETDPIQSFYIMDSDGIENINFIDSQIAFGQRYIYRIYSYDFVVGTEYHYAQNYTNNSYSPIQRTDNPIQSGGSRGNVSQLFNDTGSPSYRAGVPGVPEVANIDMSRFIQSVEDTEPENIPGLGRVFNAARINYKDFRTFVNSRPYYAVVEIPYLEREIIVMDRPPMFPEVKISPIKDSKNRIKIMLQATSGERRMAPVVIEQEDQALIDDIRLVQGLESSEQIYYESDDLPTTYQVYRTENPPQRYSDFAGLMHYSISDDKSSAVDFADFLLPNTKYYYTFRCMDKSINLSNPTIVYQVEIISDEDYAYLDVRPYNFPKPDRKFKTSFERVLFIRAPEMQRSFQVNEDLRTNARNSGQNVMFSNYLKNRHHGKTIGEFGEFSQSIYDKGRRFKVRIRSKQSQKEIDLNLSFVQQIRNFGHPANISNPLINGEQSQDLSDQIDFQRIQSLYGDNYEKHISSATEGKTASSESTGSTTGERITSGRIRGESPVMPPAGGGGGGSSGGGSGGSGY